MIDSKYTYIQPNLYRPYHVYWGYQVNCEVASYTIYKKTNGDFSVIAIVPDIFPRTFAHIMGNIINLIRNE